MPPNTRAVLSRYIACVLALLAAPEFARAVVFQYAETIALPGGKPGKVFMWIPPQADRIRGALIGGQTIFEDAFAADPEIRKACVDERLAIIQFIPSLDALFDYKKNDCAAKLQLALVKLAKSSGHPEIAFAPLFPFGHSVSSLFACRLVCWAPNRCFGALSFKGGMDLDYDPKYAGVPILVIKGQFEEFGPGPSGFLRDKIGENRETSWKSMRQTLLTMRAANDANLVSFLVDPGAGHFSWSPSNAPVVAMFVRKAARRRIPEWPITATEPVRCIDIDPKSGVLSDAEIEHPRFPAATYTEFRGNPKHAFWHFDSQMAGSIYALEAGAFDKKPQFIQFLDRAGNPIKVPDDMWMDLPLVWSGSDTITYSAAFSDHPTRRYPPIVGPAGHADSCIKFRAVAGAVEQISPDTFRIAPDGRNQMRVFVMAYNDGDAQYRHAEQISRIKIPPVLTKGKRQTITFASIPGLSSNSPPIALKATSDSGLPVHFYVESGPAEIRAGNILAISELPKHITRPCKIVVVAYQWGSAIEPLVQSATSKQEIQLAP
jgi:hypothetical protein